MSVQIAEVINAEKRKAVGKAVKISTLIEEGGQILEAIFATGPDTLSELGCVYSRQEGCFFIARSDGGPLPCARVEVALAYSVVTHVRFQAFASPSGKQEEIKLNPATTKFLNGLLEKPYSGFLLDVRTSGGGDVLGTDGLPLGQWPGRAYIRFGVHPK